jgi:hypothetical protein
LVADRRAARARAALDRHAGRAIPLSTVAFWLALIALVLLILVLAVTR